jgi:hypothetical protein
MVVLRSACLIGMTVLALVACQGDGDEATSVEREETTTVVTTAPPEQIVLTPEQKLLRWIRSCEVRQIIFSHEGVAHIKFRGGSWKRIRLDDTAADNVSATALRQRCDDFKRILVGIE